MLVVAGKLQGRNVQTRCLRDSASHCSHTCAKVLTHLHATLHPPPPERQLATCRWRPHPVAVPVARMVLAPWCSPGPARASVLVCTSLARNIPCTPPGAGAERCSCSPSGKALSKAVPAQSIPTLTIVLGIAGKCQQGAGCGWGVGRKKEKQMIRFF